MRITILCLPFALMVDRPLCLRLCDKYDTPSGCRYGKFCLFAHGTSDLTLAYARRKGKGASFEVFWRQEEFER